MESLEAGGEFEEGQELGGGGGHGVGGRGDGEEGGVPAEEGGDEDREADALAALGEVAEQEAAAGGEEHLADEAGGEAEAAVPDDGGVEGCVAAPRDLQRGDAAAGAEDEEAVGAARSAGGGGGGREKHMSWSWGIEGSFERWSGRVGTNQSLSPKIRFRLWFTGSKNTCSKWGCRFFGSLPSSMVLIEYRLLLHCASDSDFQSSNFPAQTAQNISTL